jgi:hypothetical protein
MLRALIFYLTTIYDIKSPIQKLNFEPSPKVYIILDISIINPHVY